MWVALTQHQTGRKFLFEHPAYASSWNTQMVSLVTRLKGVMLVTVDLCMLGMTDEDERSHSRMTTIMTNDSVVADALRPYRCAQDHSYASAGSRYSRRAQEHDRQFCEILTTALKASLLHRDRREPRQLMTLTVRNDEEREEDSGLEEDEQPAEYEHPTETQIKMVNQYHRNLGHPSRREFLKVLKAAHAKPQCSNTSDVNTVVRNVTHTRNHSLLERLQSPALTSLIASLPWTCSTFHCVDNLSRF